MWSRRLRGGAFDHLVVYYGVTSIISVGMMTAKFALFCEASFWRVLHLAVAERPVFPGVVDEIDPDLFFPYAGPLVDLIGYPLIEFFLISMDLPPNPRN
jgi:hypothetical protein